MTQHKPDPGHKDDQASQPGEDLNKFRASRPVHSPGPGAPISETSGVQAVGGSANSSNASDAPSAAKQHK